MLHHAACAVAVVCPSVCERTVAHTAHRVVLTVPYAQARLVRRLPGPQGHLAHRQVLWRSSRSCWPTSSHCWGRLRQGIRRPPRSALPEPLPRTGKLAAGHEVVLSSVNEVLRHLAKHGTKLIAQRSTGYNNIDLATARELGLTVAGCRTRPTRSPSSPGTGLGSGPAVVGRAPSSTSGSMGSWAEPAQPHGGGVGHRQDRHGGSLPSSPTASAVRSAGTVAEPRLPGPRHGVRPAQAGVRRIPTLMAYRYCRTPAHLVDTHALA
ncbi:hypothetical protein SAFG77S_00899 [Streptomyces afghaniensis]